MIIETLADVGTNIYFIHRGRIVCEPVASIGIDITNRGKEVVYRIANTTIENQKEEFVSLTQEGLFNKIKIIEEPSIVKQVIEDASAELS